MAPFQSRTRNSREPFAEDDTPTRCGSRTIAERQPGLTDVVLDAARTALPLLDFGWAVEDE
jgi:hypothetical protein